jgi:hypothetical protein
MKGKIYRIVCNSHPSIQYVGSTCNMLAKRWHQHKLSWQEWKDGKHKTPCSIYDYFSKYGIYDFQIILIKEYDVVDRQHLSSYEQLYINAITCVNKTNPWSVSIENCKWLNKEYQKNYSEKHKDKKRQNANENYKNNKQLVLDRHAKKIICSCSKEYTYGHKSRHLKTHFHITNC